MQQHAKDRQQSCLFDFPLEKAKCEMSGNLYRIYALSYLF